MANLWLILTNPYSYNQALERALHGIEQSGGELKVVFVIDPQSVDHLVRDLGEQGWLGLSSRRNLQESMLAGYRALAADVLEDVSEAAGAAEVSITTAVEEIALKEYLQTLNNQENLELIVSISPELSSESQEPMARVEWVQEE